MTLRQQVFLVLVAMVLACNAYANTAPIAKLIPISSEEVERLKAEPLSLLSQFLDGGPSMAEYVSRAVITDTLLVDSMLEASAQATPQQSAAMGAGMARAARMLSKKHPQKVRDIIDKVRRSGNPRLQITFLAIGPSYKTLADPKLPDIVLPPTLDTQSFGIELPEYKSRIGPPRADDLTADRRNRKYPQDGILSEQDERRVLIEDAFLAQTLISDAPKNGAVSTSPTQ